MTLACDLAGRACALTFDSLPDDAIHWAKLGILDTVGVTLAGSAESAVGILTRAIGRNGGPSLVFGRKDRISALDAALINGTAAHVLDFDDCNNTFGGHPSAVVVPALLALADELGADGRRCIAAYVAGFETECKIALGDGYVQYERGWHPTATMGVFGVATACAHLMGLDPARLATALAIAGSLASGVKANFGTMTKPLHVGQCARSGLMAALLARDGFTANMEIFEHQQGYFATFNGSGKYNLSTILETWGQPFDVVTPGIAFKQYPCCGSTHPPIDALLSITRSNEVDADEVESIECFIHPFCLKHTDRPDPRSAAEAKFSLQYCLARALVSGGVKLSHFAREDIQDDAVRRLMSKVRVAPFTAEQFPLTNYFGSEVRIAMGGGRAFLGRVDEPVGCTSRNALPLAVLREKFIDCAKFVASRASAQSLWDRGLALEEFDDLRSFTAMLETEHG